MPLFGPTTNHLEIRSWADENHATPAAVKPFLFDGEPSVLRFIFGNAELETPEFRPITWEDFFAHFDVMGLSLVYDTEPDKDTNCRYEFLQQEGKDPYLPQKPVPMTLVD